MIRRPPRSTRTDTLFPYTTRFRSGPVAAGDTVRWIIGDTISGSGATARVHILVKPTRPDIATNLVINTDRRTYHLELRATPATYTASVSWTYPQRAEERRVGKVCVSTCRAWGLPDHNKEQNMCSN